MGRWVIVVLYNQSSFKPPSHPPTFPLPLEFAEFTAEDVGTVDSGLNSMVLASNNEKVLLPVNEPTHGTKRKSQVDKLNPPTHPPTHPLIHCFFLLFTFHSNLLLFLLFILSPTHRFKPT